MERDVGSLEVILRSCIIACALIGKMRVEFLKIRKFQKIIKNGCMGEIQGRFLSVF